MLEEPTDAGRPSDATEELRTTLRQAVENQLPGRHYHDAATFSTEMTTIFRESWHLAGHESEVASAGTFKTIRVGEESIILWRGADGCLRGYHNVCPHRGTRLVDGGGNCSTIVCPYHAWQFDDCGAVRSIPRKTAMVSPHDESQLGLFKAAVSTWRGFVFVHPRPAPVVGLSEFLADFPEFLGGYSERYEDLREIARITFRERLNWKLVVENYIEDYHFGYVHPATLKVFDFRAVKTLPTGDHCRVYMPYRQEMPDGDCKYPWEPSGGSYQGYFFPSGTIQTARNHVSLFRIIPVQPEETIVEIPIFQTPRQQEQFPLSVPALEAEVRNDMEEDFVICRNLQANVHSPLFRAGALVGEHELGIAHFQSVWRRYMRTAL